MSKTSLEAVKQNSLSNYIVKDLQSIDNGIPDNLKINKLIIPEIIDTDAPVVCVNYSEHAEQYVP